MPEKGLSRQEVNRRRRHSGFVGRHRELTGFQDNLARDPESDAFQYLFHVHGHAGVGKTSLVRQWEAAARESGAVTAYIDDDVHSVVEAMAAISAQFARQGVTLKGFEKLLAAYRQRRHEAENSASDGQPADTAAVGPSTTGTLLAQGSLFGLGLLPGMGPIAGAMDPQQLAQGADRVRAALAAKFRNHSDVHLVMSPVRVLTPVFLEDFAEVAGQRPRVVLFFDVFERTGPVLTEWLRDVLVGDEYLELPTNVVAVLAGQGELDRRYWGDHLDLVTKVPLGVFTEDETRQLLAVRGITNEDVIQVIFRLTGRLPVLVATLAQNRPQDSDEVGDPSDTAVERFLKWITDPDQQAAARACALPLQLDEDIFRVIVPDTVAGQYAWLRSLPFVTGQAGRCRYHDVVRSPMLRLQRTQSPARWRQQHAHLARAYQERRQTLEETLPSGRFWEDTAWREHRLNETYHHLCAHPRQALADALRDVMQACDEGPALLRRWVQMLVQASQDADAAPLIDWVRGLQFSSAQTDESTVVFNTLTRLLTAPELTPSDRALAHTLRGREHRNALRYEQALAEYASALAADPDLARAHYGRGETLRQMGRNDEALTELDRALELEPADSWTHSSRGEACLALGRHDEALADFDRAIELEPKDAWALVGRGKTHLTLGRHNEALADYDRAVEGNSTLPWVTTSRGQAYQVMMRYDEALADFGRVLAANNADTWVLSCRGETYVAMGRYDEALADYDRAIELDSTAAWVVAGHGEVLRLLGRYEEALADFDRALELDGNSALALANRGQTYQVLGRYEEALADLNRAVELDDTFAFAISARGETHRLMARHDEALADFDRALGLDDALAWAVASRAQTYQAMGDHDRALADFDRALGLDGALAWAVAGRAETHQAVGRYDEAIADYTRAIEANANPAWIVGRGENHALSGCFEEALADFDRAVDLDDTFAWALTCRGETYQLMGRLDEALADFDRSIDLDRDDPVALGSRGQTRQALGLLDEAVADFDRALELAPDVAWV
ncbi:tetratricopeptide repeat protein, partial [Streptomyces sp. NPDC007901]|uniref:tetratricopeptide repeat protein n=1 Tax=Streptomyces sp. NPDC007901 TaxID=3364785 RepID=UPI0036E9633C